MTSRSIENLLYTRAVVNRSFGYYARPKFHPERSSKDPHFDWQKLKEVFHPFILIMPAPGNPSFPEIMFTDKDVSWGTRDINMWVGSDTRKIYEIDDLTEDEGITWWGTGLRLCRDLSRQSHINHSFSIGFNPRDIGKPGHHNVNWLHAHLRAYDDKLDTSTIVPRNWIDMNWFDRLTFIEPFTQLFYDYLGYLSKTYSIKTHQIEHASMVNGVVTIPVDTDNVGLLTREIKGLYVSMKTEYSKVEDIFTERSLDQSTGRYIPLDQKIRNERLVAYLDSRGFYSPKSKELLRYLAKNLVRAEKRSNKRDSFIENASHINISKGFAGAFVLAYSLDQDRFRFEFIPRVISSSAVAKTMYGKDRPTLMGKHIPATASQREIIEEYKMLILENVLAMDSIQGTIKSELLPVA